MLDRIVNIPDELPILVFAPFHPDSVRNWQSEELTNVEVHSFRFSHFTSLHSLIPTIQVKYDQMHKQGLIAGWRLLFNIRPRVPYPRQFWLLVKALPNFAVLSSERDEIADVPGTHIPAQSDSSKKQTANNSCGFQQPRAV